MAKANLKHYQDGAGHVFSLNESDAELLRYKPVDIAKVKADQKAADEAAKDAQLSEREKALREREADLERREKALGQAKGK